MNYRAFISYAVNDAHAPWVQQFAADLVELGGIEVEFDRYSVNYGDKFSDFMQRGIHSSKFFLFVSTNESRKVADFEDPAYGERGLWYELEEAQRISQESGRVFRQICILREGKPPRRFADTRYADFRDDSKYRETLNELIMHIKHGPRKPSPPSYEAVFRVGNIEVPHIVSELLFLGDNAMKITDVRCEYDSTWVSLPPHLEALRTPYVESLRSAALRRGFTFDNNLSYSLHTVSVERPQANSGLRHNRLALVVRPTDYFNFVFPNLALDEQLVIDGRKTTLRHELGLGHHELRIEKLPDYSCHFRIGTGTVFVTADQQIVVSLRSRMEFVVGGTKYHLSTAEGMLRPADEQNGQVSPFFTSIRSLADELGLVAEADYATDAIRCLGLVLDTERAQPILIFFVGHSNVTLAQVRQRWQLRAKDKHENVDIIGLPWNESTARILLSGRLDHGHTLYEVASNHAQCGFLLAALHSFGERVFSEAVC